MIIEDKNQNSLGRIEVKDLPLPAGIEPITATYTYSGKVLLSYAEQGTSNNTDPDYQNLAVLDDDGNNFRKIFSGIIRQHKKANGIRFMCFADNKRVLLGDYVLECSPDIDNAETAVLVPVEYPWNIVNDSRVIRHWSEIIIAPDNEHISWTILTFGGTGAVNGLGKLTRQHDKYVITNAQVISSFSSFEKDTQHPEFIIPLITRGGEVKQFIRGGTAISLVGSAKESRLADSVVQELTSEKIVRITNAPGYDETTIFSPDERLGLVMSSRASPKTDPAIFGLMPRPHAFALQGMIMILYLYAVAGVRKFRKGNIGPVLIDINRSMNEKDYRGVALFDPAEEWVYYSPMSWHPESTKVMWPEGLRGTSRMRIRIAHLLDYTPGTAPAAPITPDDISYAEKDLAKLDTPKDRVMEGKIAGKHSGYIECKRQVPQGVEAIYVNYSDDGKTFYNGNEKTGYSTAGETIYEADLTMSGAEQGEMKFRACFSKVVGFEPPPLLLFEKAEDGKPKSYGYAAYGGIRLNIDDLLE